MNFKINESKMNVHVNLTYYKCWFYWRNMFPQIISKCYIFCINLHNVCVIF